MMPIYSGQEASSFVEKLENRRATESAAACEQHATIEARVRDIIEQIRQDGDTGLSRIARSLGDREPRQVLLDGRQVEELAARLPVEHKAIIDLAASRIERFANATMQALNQIVVDFGEYKAGLDLRPVRRVACYVPAGRYPLPSTALMTAVTARAAGVSDICILTPQLRDEILYAGTVAGVREFHEIGGAQAIAAAALGTDTIRSVDMIVGPGNAYVTEAKRQLQGRVGIDMLAGPSEIAVIADKGGNAHWLSLDLISQAEHDPDSRAYLLTDDLSLAQEVARVMPEALRSTKLPEFVQESIGHSAILVFANLDECASAANTIAPEHLQLHVKEPAALKPKLQNYGALFMGYYATVPFGDYVAGTNHTLPTNRAARFCGGLSPLTFLRAQSWIDVPGRVMNLPREAATFAALEGLHGHEAASLARIGVASKK